ncbi:hypothetical protein L7F22_035721 [Adiantum nelumboides]|nr:hypothetical protein [Adiantum nelumboides]
MGVSRSSRDPFDQLPDSLLLCIFNKLHDIKALGRCAAVSKRFSTVVLQAEEVVVKVDCVISTEDSNLSMKGKSLLTSLFKVLVGSLVKPLHALQQLLTCKKSILPEVSHHSPGEVLKNFKGIRHLKIELPGGELGLNNGIVMKWRAEFGSTLESCVILAASSLIKRDGDDNKVSKCTESCSVSGENSLTVQDGNGSIPESFFTNGGLKLRVVWTISSLIAASARHYLLQQIIIDHPTLESLTLADADGQGTLSMSKQQLVDFRDKPIAASASSNRTQVPALNIRLWYAPFLDLPGGSAMEGATLVAIRPSDHLAKKDSEAFLMNAFEEPFNNAAGSLVRGRTYLLEMNSF